jgi:hypothetical protein
MSILLISIATAGDKNTQLCYYTQEDNIKQGNNNVGVLNQPFSFIFPGAQTRKGFAERGTVHSLQPTPTAGWPSRLFDMVFGNLVPRPFPTPI